MKKIHVSIWRIKYLSFVFVEDVGKEYEIVFKDQVIEECSSTLLQEQVSVSVSTCKENCKVSESCNYFLYTSDGICRLYETCPEQNNFPKYSLNSRQIEATTTTATLFKSKSILDSLRLIILFINLCIKTPDTIITL